MRIQHNIMAMSSYRNYTNNVSSMKKNLEKLSSGYKINRAGDDAAGLAISEKMRAQITGLETAQKNAKDGISLVQTAEGALTEVHDMLNRMVELATQSANGTYDDDVDRLQMQKEMDQLTSEINRIADSANFNGINLLDGSLDGNPVAGELKNILAAAAGAADPALPTVGTILGKDTVLHKGATAATNAQFGFSLHNVTYSNDDATGSIVIKFGGDEIRLSGGATKAELGTGDILTAMNTAGGNVRAMSIGGKEYTVEGDTLREQLQSFADQYNADAANTHWSAAIDESGNKIKFSTKQLGTVATTNSGATQPTGGTLTDGVDATMHKNTGTVAIGTAFTKGDTFTIKGQTYEIVDVGGTATIAGATAVDTATMSANYLAGLLQGHIDVEGFGAATASNDKLEISALKAGLNTTEMPGLEDLVTFGTNNTGKATLTWDTTTDAGVDAKAATVVSGVVAKKTAELTIGDGTYKVTSTDARDQINEFITQYNADKTKNYTASWNDNGDGVKFVAKKAGSLDSDANPITPVTLGTAGANQASTANGGKDGSSSALGTDDKMDAKAILAAIMGGKATLNNVALTQDMLARGVTLSDGATYKVTVENNYTLTFTQVDNDTGTAVLDREVTVSDGNNHAINESAWVKGDYQKSTTYNEGKAADDVNRLASTYFTLTADMVADTGAMFIGGTSYTFTTDADAAKADSTKVYIGDLVDSETGKFDVGEDNKNLTKVVERITVAARDNKVYTVGFDKNRLTFTERPDYTTGSQEYDLTKLDEIQRSLGYVGPETPSEGSALTLQIGDTADDFNQLKVNIKDMHAGSLGLDKISILSQANAATAVDVIKEAINTVSDVRGSLGATQNRLEHTINNLSVMTENIQDAESTIRDTDVAEEMMAYTKNNILIQSAQAMLAQANQVPQGVLQLLG